MMSVRAVQDETEADLAHFVPVGHEEPILDYQTMDLDASSAAIKAAVSGGGHCSLWLHKRLDLQGSCI